MILTIEIADIQGFNPEANFNFEKANASFRSQLIQFDINSDQPGALQVNRYNQGVCRFIVRDPDTEIDEVYVNVHSVSPGPRLLEMLNISVEGRNGDGTLGDGRQERWLVVYLKEGAAARGQVTLSATILISKIPVGRRLRLRQPVRDSAFNILDDFKENAGKAEDFEGIRRSLTAHNLDDNDANLGIVYCLATGWLTFNDEGKFIITGLGKLAAEDSPFVVHGTEFGEALMDEQGRPITDPHWQDPDDMGRKLEKILEFKFRDPRDADKNDGRDRGTGDGRDGRDNPKDRDQGGVKDEGGEGGGGGKPDAPAK